jgi:hypothetical protein
MHEVKLSGGPFDGQVLQSPKPVFDLQIRFEPGDEKETVEVDQLELHVYRDVDADEQDDVLTWCESRTDPFSLSFDEQF